MSQALAELCESLKITSVRFGTYAVLDPAQNILQFAYNSGKAASSHLTRLLATEFALKGVPVRVNAVAPGVCFELFLSNWFEMTVTICERRCLCNGNDTKRYSGSHVL